MENDVAYTGENGIVKRQENYMIIKDSGFEKN